MHGHVRGGSSNRLNDREDLSRLAMASQLSPTGITALATASIAALLLFHYVLIRPKLTMITRVRLLLGLGVFPTATAALYTADAMQKTTTRAFCGSCHVMREHLKDVDNPESTSLAARHSRNSYFGASSCYSCHADYEGIMGYPLTKLRGMRHLYMYYLAGYRSMPLERAVRTITLATPYPNSNCVQCHSIRLDSFMEVREHGALLDALEANTVACASAGCHGYSHPFSKKPTLEHASR